ncbi:MAG: type II secretion system protein [Verrucomicrobiales bacterium]|nr:type II secretion system protein [Verrucomicrobiales bacterium]
MKRTPQTAGFSLLEVLCAVLILGVGVAGMTHGVATALRSSKESEIETRAALMAAGRIEILRAEGFLSAGGREGRGEQDLAGYRWQESLTETDLDGLYEVVVTVRLEESDRPVYELRTLLFDVPVSPTVSTDNTTPDATGGRDRNRSPRR